MDDLLVVGGGPVGLATALYAARAGLRVTVVERRDGTIDKACGEGLMPGAVAALADLGVDPAGAAIEGITYVAGDRRATAPFRRGPGRGVRRTVLHTTLAEAADAAGVERVKGTVTDVRQDTVHVRVALRDGAESRSAHYLVAADGLHSPVRRMCGLDLPGPRLAGGAIGTLLRTGPGSDPERGPRHGLRRHYALTPWSRTVEVHWGERAEAYVTPVSDDSVGVAILTRQRLGFEALLADFPTLRERIGGAAVVSDDRGAGPLRQRSRRRVHGRVLLVGDASGYVDALTGEGIALGLTQARQAVTAIAGGGPAAYERAWLAVSRRPNALTAGLELVTRAPLARKAIVPLAAAAPGLFARIVDELARPARDLDAAVVVA